jgi:hypothetical protein
MDSAETTFKKACALPLLEETEDVVILMHVG